MKTSQPAERRSSASRPSSAAMSMASERLLAFMLRNTALSPFQKGGPQTRASSPRPGRSTFTTSAPSAPSSIAQ